MMGSTDGSAHISAEHLPGAMDEWFFRGNCRATEFNPIKSHLSVSAVSVRFFSLQILIIHRKVNAITFADMFAFNSLLAKTMGDGCEPKLKTH